ncbi:hypothetical protein E2C01_074943 [Portunus trituberculatus]|uniref:Uncharacterized protein n=1 Tax=Portunus trituberculatus TaxID=210409 RepID=A0A5B7IDQ4_PORTR|nr:hypothetical protein [Portunus trituberculatus]
MAGRRGPWQGGRGSCSWNKLRPSYTRTDGGVTRRQGE